ncbi:Serine/threonine-protein kinase PknB [Planctomycetes bacterium Pan216]|uniref:Serine/threonine-protein kinase PknB n=1 Tax=Kolteria novifilia TaxID=2527975 RepID=A0A518BCK6_9BACT|nr:Serine/threonine-protein kinase PknB [Planctomycetes bacterium Pan216]
MISISEFARRAWQSELVDRDQVRAIIQKLPENRRTAEGLAMAMVRRGLLTLWQAKQIAANRAKLLIVDQRYRLLSKLGEGGMGAVFRARDTRLQRQVAIKIPRPKILRKKRYFARFQREIVANGRLEHPNIVRAIDVGSDGDLHYIVMEYVDGEDLASLARRAGGLPPDIAVNYILQAAKALQYAHEQGIIHRDLKPSNLMATRDGRLKILDMGLALINVEGDEQPSDVTLIGALVGTVGYMAPEQAEDTHAADDRSDIYSLGCTFHHLLTGQAPYGIENSTATLVRHVRDPIPEVPGIDATLRAIHDRMMAKSPDDRYQSMAALSAELRRWQLVVSDEDTVDGPAETIEDREVFEPVGKALSGESGHESLSVFPDDRDIPDWLDRSAASGQRRLKRLEQEGGWSPRMLASVILAVGLLLVIGAVSYSTWHRLGQTRMTLQWPPDQRAGASLRVDGVLVPLATSGPIQLAGPWGKRHLHLMRPGYHPQSIDVNLARGESRAIPLEWRATPKRLRELELESLTKEAHDAIVQGDREQMEAIRARCLDFVKREAGTLFALEASALLANLPSPFDEGTLSVDSAEVPTLDEDVAVTRLYQREENPFAVWGPIVHAAYTPTGDLLITGSGPMVRVRDGATGRPIEELGPLPSPVSLVAIEPHGRFVAAACEDKTVRLLEREGDDPEEIRAGAEITAIAFDTSGKLVAIGTEQGDLKIARIEKGEPRLIRSASPDLGTIEALRFAPAGSRLLVAGKRGAGIWDGATSEPIGWSWDSPLSSREAVAWSPDGQLIAAATTDRAVRFWDATTGEDHPLIAVSGRVRTLAFGPTAGQLLVGTDRSLDIWNVETGELQVEVRHHRRRPELLLADAKGTQLACFDDPFAGYLPGTISLWRADANHIEMVATSASIMGAAWDSPRTHLAANYTDGKVLVWDAIQARERFRLGNEAFDPMALTFTPDSDSLITGSRDGSIRRWNSKDGKLRQILDTPRSSEGEDVPITRVAIAPDNAMISAGRRDGKVLLWTAETRSPRYTLHKGSTPVSGLGFSPNSQVLFASIIGDPDEKVSGVLSVWEALSGRLWYSTEQADLGFADLAVSPNGKMVASADWANHLHLWDIETGRRLQTLEVASEGNYHTLCLAFSPDSSLLAAAGTDGAVRTWNADGTLTRSIQVGAPDSLVVSVGFSPSGRHLLTACGEGTIYVLKLAEIASQVLDQASHEVASPPDGNSPLLPPEDPSNPTR